MNKQKQGIVVLTMIASLSLAACGQTTSDKSHPNGTDAQTNRAYQLEVTHENDAIEGGTLKYGVVSASAFQGILSDELSEFAIDKTINFVDEGMFGFDNDRKIDDSGLATIDVDVDAKTVTVKLTGQDYRWSDGQPFTIDDYIFTIEALAHKDYTGIRYDSTFKNIVGAEDYHAGTANSIEGIKKIDDYTVQLTYLKISPSLLLAEGGVPHYVAPKHIFASIPLAEWETSEYVRSNKVVGLGPFKVQAIVPGESISYIANEYYYKGKPKLDGLIVEKIAPETVVSEVRAGKYDIVKMPLAQFDAYEKGLSNTTLVHELEPFYEYISFKLGTYDAETGQNVYDPNRKMANQSLRQAMAYAIDVQSAGDSLYFGLLNNTNSLIIPYYQDINDPTIEGYSYQPEKAKQLLDEAGYRDSDGDGFREDPTGQPLKIIYAARTRDNANEALTQQYLAWWKEVGLNVELYSGRTMELNTFYEAVRSNDNDIDLFGGGWAVDYDPNPTSLYGPNARFNFTRFVSDEQTALLEQLESPAVFDPAAYKQAYSEWQAYAAEQAFTIPTLSGYSVYAINKRVKYFDTYIGSKSNGSYTIQTISKLELTAPQIQAAE